MTAIVCVDKNWAIGRDNALLFHISADLKRFKALTTGKTVVMGKNTLLSLPGGRPLPNRRNLVVSTTMVWRSRAASGRPRRWRERTPCSWAARSFTARCCRAASACW